MWDNVGAEAYANSQGKKLREFGLAMANAASEFNCPIIDGYKALGVDSYNNAAFSIDGTHLNNYGRQAFGEYIGGCLIAAQTAADKQETIGDIHPTYYIDLAGTYPKYTCPVAMDDIKAAYNSGYNLVCRCKMSVYTAKLPLFVPMPAANTWIFSGSGALQSMDFPAQSFTIAITANGVSAQNVALSKPLNITVGDTTYNYDGSYPVNVAVKPATQSITTTGTGILLDNTEYRLTDVTTLTLNYPTGDFECWMRLTFAESGNITVTLPADTKYIGTAPDFKNGETWELSFKDKILAAQKVGEGT